MKLYGTGFPSESRAMGGSHMKGISEPVSCELDIRNSRFLAEAFPVSSQEDARALLKALKDKYADATHVVHAFVIGPGGGILGRGEGACCRCLPPGAGVA